VLGAKLLRVNDDDEDYLIVMQDRGWSVFAAMVRASGRIRQISVILGSAAGGAAYGPTLGDLVVVAQRGPIFVTGPTS
jgi:acetyl-CoA carboxylase carboxyltransferase component